MRQALSSSRAVSFRTGPAAAAARGARPYGKEIKTVDVQLVSGLTNQLFNPIIESLNSNLSAALLNGVQQGTADYNRVGKSINIKSLRVTGAFFNVFTLPVITNSGYNDKLIRMVIVHIKSGTTAIPNFDDIFGGIDQNGTVYNNMTSGVKPWLMHDVTVLRDKIFRINEDNAMLGTGDQRCVRLPFDEYIPLKGIQTIYKGNAVPITISTIETGAIVMYCRCSFDLSADRAGITETGVARLRYEDH